MATQGAIQLDVTINGESISVDRKYLSSLNVTRVVGDSANEFTLEVFDETAYKIEALLAQNRENKKDFAPISIRYSAANNFNNGKGDCAVFFSGVCYDYQLTFVGMSTMLSVSGLLSYSSTSGATTNWWFDKTTVCWCGIDPEDRNPVYDNQNNIISHDWYVDGKSEQMINDALGEDGNGGADANLNDLVCAKLKFDEENDKQHNTPTVLINPSRIFRRILQVYGARCQGASFPIGTIQDTEWVDSSVFNPYQINENAATYITNNLAPISVLKNTTLGGFNYSCDFRGHNFKSMSSDIDDATKHIAIQYAHKNSNVISFSISSVGALVMGITDNAVSDSTMNKTYGVCESNLEENIFKYNIEDALSAEKQQSNNWYFKTNFNPIKIQTSGSSDGLQRIQQSLLDPVESACIEAQLTIWGEYSSTLVPGNYVDLTILTSTGKRHYSSGIYYILEIKDSISNSGYTQTLQLLKIRTLAGKDLIDYSKPETKAEDNNSTNGTSNQTLPQKEPITDSEIVPSIWKQNRPNNNSNGKSGSSNGKAGILSGGGK